MTKTITRENAQTVLQIVDAGLVAGLGQPIPGKMCVEAAVCYALGIPHGDDPQCVSPAVRSLKIKLNDAAWSSSAARAAGMRRLAILQLGTAGVLDESEFTRRVVEMVIRKIVPRALRAVAKATGDETLESAALRCEAEGSKKSAIAAYNAARAAYFDYDLADAADAVAVHAAYTAATNATSVAHAVADDTCCDEYAYAARAAVRCAAYAAYATRNDEVLILFADEVAAILVDMNVPAVAWLDLL